MNASDVGFLYLYFVCGLLYWLFGTRMSLHNGVIVMLTWPLDLIMRAIRYYKNWNAENQ